MRTKVDSYLAGRTWLLIYDNVEEAELLEKHVPSKPGPILITTRYSSVAFKAGGITEPAELLPFDPVESAVLFSGFRKKYKRSGAPGKIPSPEETAATKVLLEFTAGLAVGIEHIAAYIECDKLTVVEFLEKYKRMAADIYKRKDTGSNAPHTLDTLWAVSTNRIKEKSHNAFQLLSILSVLSPDDIRLQIFNLEDEEDDEEFDSVITPVSSFCEDFRTYIFSPVTPFLFVDIL